MNTCSTHLGIDIMTPIGTPVYAIADGFEVRLEWHSDFGGCNVPGWALFVKHRKLDGHYFWALYGHVQANAVQAPPISKGEIIAYIADYNPCTLLNGNCSGSNCPHLHFGIWDAEAFPSSPFGYGTQRSYTDPDQFVANTTPWPASDAVQVSGVLTVRSTREAPESVFALPDEYGPDPSAPEEGEKNFAVKFRLQNGSAQAKTIEDFGIGIWKAETHQFDISYGQQVILQPGEVSALFDKRGWITDTRLDGGAATSFEARVWYRESGVTKSPSGSGGTASLVVNPRPSLATSMLVKRPHPAGNADPLLSKVYYHQWGYRWEIATETVATSLFPNWAKEFYVYPTAAIDGLSLPKPPSHDPTTAVLVGRNLLFKKRDADTIYIIEPEPGPSGPLRSRPFADERAFWSYGYAQSPLPHDLTTQPVELGASWYWVIGQYPVGSTITVDAPTLRVTPTLRHVSWLEDAGTLLVENTGSGSMNWTAWVTSGSLWLTITSGHSAVTNTGTVEVSALYNSSTSERIGTIDVIAPSSSVPVITVTVVQAAHPTGNIWHVNASGTGDYPTIQSAVDASITGDVILLSDGVFTGEGNRNISFHGKDLVVRSESGNRAACIMDIGGSNSHTGFFLCSGETPASVIEGITIRNGGWSPGGAVTICSAAPTISNCAFEENSNASISGNGGAISLYASSSTIKGCRFAHNAAGNVGGAVSIYGPSSVTVTDNVFENNTAQFGGAIVASSGNHLIERNVFQDNQAVGSEYSCASGIFLDGEGSPTGDRIRRNVFTGNRCDTDQCTVYLYDCAPTIEENTWAGNDGSAIICEYGANAEIRRNIFQASEGNIVKCLGWGEHLSAPVLSENAFWENGGGNGICGIGEGENIVENPLLCAPEIGLVYLAPNSPCLEGNHPVGVSCGLIGACGSGCDVVGVVTEVPKEKDLSVVRNRPNPFSRSTHVEFVASEAGSGMIEVFSISGRLVKSRRDVTVYEGLNDITLDCAGLSGGIYFYRLTGPGLDETRKMVLVD